MQLQYEPSTVECHNQDHPEAQNLKYLKPKQQPDSVSAFQIRVMSASKVIHACTKIKLNIHKGIKVK
jgi:hypothetical protein